MKQREMVASLAVALRLLYWTQTEACGRGLLTVRAGGFMMGADGMRLGADVFMVGADGYQWARTEADMARLGLYGRGRLGMCADGSQ